MINLVLVENDVYYKKMMSDILACQEDLTIRGFGNDYYDAIMLVKKHKPDIAIIDTAPDNSEMNIARVLKRYSPETSIAILSSNIKDTLIKEMAKGTITNYLLKDYDIKKLANIIRGIHRGEPYINPRINARIFQLLADHFQVNGNNQKEATHIINHGRKVHDFKEDFSKTELEILHYISKGYTSKDMARTLYIKEGSVRNYVSSIMRKTKLKSRTQIVLYAQKFGFKNEIINLACNPSQMKVK